MVRASRLVLHSERLIIEPLGPSDVADFVRYRQEPDVARWQSWTTDYSADDAAALVADQPSGLPELGRWLQLALHDRRDGRLLGDVAVHRVCDTPATFELGVTLAPASQHRGLAAEALRCVLDLLRDTGADSVHAICDARNHPVAALLGGLGFTLTGHDEAAEFEDGEWLDLDTWTMSLQPPSSHDSASG